MIFSTKQNLDDRIVVFLLTSPCSVKIIQEKLEHDHIFVTIQAIYKSLRELVRQDIIVKHKDSYSINSVWQEKLHNLITQRKSFSLENGEYVNYRFNKLEHIDAFWRHIISDIEKQTDPHPIFHFTPHNFWILLTGRERGQYEYYNTRKNKKRFIFSLVGGKTIFDKITQKKLESKTHQIHLEKISLSRRDHPTVIGDYVINTKISPILAESIDAAYITVGSEQDLTETLDALLKKPGNIYISIENNPKKAHQLRKRFSKYFAIPKYLQEII